MKKSFFLVIMLLVSVSCTKSYYADHYHSNPIQGSGSAEDTSAYEKYLCSIAQQFVADNLLAAEGAILFDKTGRYETDEGAVIHPDGQSIWIEGAVWTIDRETSIKGVKMEKTAQDSTWILSRDAEYALPSGSYPTKYSLLVTCHKSYHSARGGSHFNWDVSFTEFERTEQEGYSAKCSTTDPLFYDAGRRESSSWASCKGGLSMDVYQNGDRIDGLYVLYTGSGDTHQFIREI